MPKSLLTIEIDYSFQSEYGNSDRIRTDTRHIFFDNGKKKTIHIYLRGITYHDSLQIIDTKKNIECGVEIIYYVMTWGGIVTKYLNPYLKRLQVFFNLTVEIIFFDLRRVLESRLNAEESSERASIDAIHDCEIYPQSVFVFLIHANGKKGSKKKTNTKLLKLKMLKKESKPKY
ncbi:hypothetical protein CWI38_0399p0020 [Hamiltosporidium tvaerminnensis]|uniref:Uncharacterized protein n=1 Tax=Hamiltosporidium tvaerminnensis TaxID=1176355 RepID=A0A4Q9LYT1_9MICR|nr:hypothetical protein CWI38_0399p0020 [Hamiltosporidium tvaerminnensis]